MEISTILANRIWNKNINSLYKCLNKISYLHIEKWKLLSRVWFFVTSWTIQSMEFSGPNTGVGSHSILQGIFPTQRLNPGLLHCRWILYQLSHKGSPRILEWVAYPFSSRSSQPRSQNRVSCIAGRFFTSWATREALSTYMHVGKYLGFPDVIVVRNLLASAGDDRDVNSVPGLGKSPWKQVWQPTPVFLPGKSHGQRSLGGYSP